jgi:hypothetical protein
VKIPNKTNQIASLLKRGRVAIIKDNASNKHPKKEKKPSPKTMNLNQPLIEWSQVDIDIPQSSSQVRNINEAGTSEKPNTLVLGNHEKSNGTQEISINYNSPIEVYDHNTTLVTHASQP